jgi:hypothetical protein
MAKEPEDLFGGISESEQARFDVFDALEEASADPQDQKILWPDGVRLSIEETASKIHLELGIPLELVQSRVVGWIEAGYEPEGLDEGEMEEFELLIEQWIAPYDGLD